MWRRVASTPLDRHRTDEEIESRSCDHDPPVTWSSIGRRGGAVEELHDRGVIEPRSRRDRAAIEEILARAWRGFVSHRSASDRRSPNTTVGIRSRPDRGAIVAKIAAKTWQIWSEIEAKHELIRRGIEATTQAEGIASTTTANRLHDRLHHPRFRA